MEKGLFRQFLNYAKKVKKLDFAYMNFVSS